MKFLFSSDIILTGSGALISFGGKDKSNKYLSFGIGVSDSESCLIDADINSDSLLLCPIFFSF